MPRDPFLNYLALGLLIFVAVTLFYGIIAIHDIPARIAKTPFHRPQIPAVIAWWRGPEPWSRQCRDAI